MEGRAIFFCTAHPERVKVISDESICIMRAGKKGQSHGKPRFLSVRCPRARAEPTVSDRRNREKGGRKTEENNSDFE